MSLTAESGRIGPSEDELGKAFKAVRQRSDDLAAPLNEEDMVIQTMPEVSPTKWHLAHTSWFFEKFLLEAHLPGYQPFDPRFTYLFNSYYYTIGSMHPRTERGQLTRPRVDEVHAYRAWVDEHMTSLLERDHTADLRRLLRLGIHHEQQHQELMLTDIKHVYFNDPSRPAYHALGVNVPPRSERMNFLPGPEGVQEIGHEGEGFFFDNEAPRHRVYVHPHQIADRLVSCGEFREFVRDGGYSRPELWLSDGWSTVQERDWNRPLYWNEDLEQLFTLAGTREIDPREPVCHVSFYEAHAFAEWAGARLPTEAEWELAGSKVPVEGNLQESGMLHPAPDTGGKGLRQAFGDCWEWTASPYMNYPGYRPPPGPVGEYNGKFMCNQMVLRGGSCATPASHIRPTYRNFFYPHDRWQFSGIRLARDA
jgi:ergothioneine biosynthesis protein EgtB